MLAVIMVLPAELPAVIVPFDTFATELFALAHVTVAPAGTVVATSAAVPFLATVNVCLLR